MIIGIRGGISSGKDTVGNWLYDRYTEMYPNKNVQIKKFASKVKEIATILTGIPIEQFEIEDVKNSYLPREWNYICSDGKEHRMTVRELLQRIGTEAGRNGIHSNIWINATFSSYNPNSDIFIITDMRFKNEFNSVRNRDGYTVLIDRKMPFQEWYRLIFKSYPNEKSDIYIDKFEFISKFLSVVRNLSESDKQLWDEFIRASNHISETDLLDIQSFRWDAFIKNHYDLEFLENECKSKFSKWDYSTY